MYTAEKPFDDMDYIFEPKSNGVRLLLHNKNGVRRLFTRHGTELTGRIPEIENIDLPNCYLDGELVCYQNGIEDFEKVMSRINSNKASTISNGSINYPLTYIVFDLLHNQNDLRQLELIERKSILENLFDDSDSIKKTFYIDGSGIGLFERIKDIGAEGIVAKTKASTYQSKRSYDWLKIINWRQHVCHITGFKKNGTGWLIALEENERLITAGLVEFGMNETHKKAFYGVAQQLITGENNQYVFIEPLLRCNIKSRGPLSSGMLHTPVFLDFIT
ncbi:ATP-dependent DNA ligase [Gottfriedia acidiceleris]|uniref:ATP-dependent DNA ligase n=1 Tax=Gottfriedia acidiceleris TaxID=371036 RepID=UPI0033942EBD